MHAGRLIDRWMDGCKDGVTERQADVASMHCNVECYLVISLPHRLLVGGKLNVHMNPPEVVASIVKLVRTAPILVTVCSYWLLLLQRETGPCITQQWSGPNVSIHTWLLVVVVDLWCLLWKWDSRRATAVESIHIVVCCMELPLQVLGKVLLQFEVRWIHGCLATTCWEIMHMLIERLWLLGV